MSGGGLADTEGAVLRGHSWTLLAEMCFDCDILFILAPFL